MILEDDVKFKIKIDEIKEIINFIENLGDKMFVYNLEDFLETWESTILTQNQTQALTKDNTETIFNAKDTYLIPSVTEGQIIKNETKIPNTNVGSKSYESVVLKYKKLSSFLKMFLSSY